MYEKKRIQNKLVSYFPKRPPKKAILSLMHYGDDDTADNTSGVISNTDVYFVNESDEILDEVSSEGWGFVGVSSTVNNPQFTYENVLPGEAVKIDTFNIQTDSDFVLGTTIYVTSKNLGKVKFKPKSGKGRIPEQPLLWEDESIPRYVVMQKIQDVSKIDTYVLLDE